MYIHPFVQDLSGMSLDQLSETMSKLNKNLVYMQRLGKHDMIRQMQMVLSNYQAEYQRKQQELWNKKSQNFDKKIDIQ